MGVVFGGWKIFGRKQNATEYKTVKAEWGTLIDSISASGSVLSVNIMSANTKASGIVKQVFIKDGDLVKKGDKILEINLDFQGQQKNAQTWSSYQSAKNNLESAKVTQYTLQSDMLSKWDTFKELAESDTYKDTNSDNRKLPEFYIPWDNWLAAEAKYKNQAAVISQVQTALNSAWLDYVLTSPIITAPTDGTITSLMYIEGMSIGSLDTGSSTSNQKVATIKTEGTPIVAVNLSEIDVSRAEIGKKATITFDSITDKTFTGEVKGIDRIGQTSSGVTQYPAIIRLDTGSEEILPNMTVTANILVNSKEDVLMIPSSAIQTQNNKKYVKVLKNKKAEQVEVEIGMESSSQAEVVSGLNEGDEVITGTNTTSSSTTSSFSSSRGLGGMMGGQR